MEIYAFDDGLGGKLLVKIDHKRGGTVELVRSTRKGQEILMNLIDRYQVDTSTGQEVIIRNGVEAR